MNYEELLRALDEEHVEYVLVGGLAANLHGTTRITKDVDIAYDSSSGNRARLCKVINRFLPRRMVLGQAEGGAIQLTPGILKRDRIVQLDTSVGQVDLLPTIRGFFNYWNIKQASTTGESEQGCPVRFLSIEGLLKAKKALKRPKDVQDIVELEALLEIERLRHCHPERSAEGAKSRERRNQ
jgi:hypothetical protein